MVAGIVVTHGNLAEELLRTARTVYGEFSDCYSLSNASKSTNELAKEIESVISNIKGGPCIIFVDFIGGSCSHASLRQVSAGGNVRDVQIISGVNLPMLLAFLNKRDEVSFEELSDAILERSYNSIKMLDPTKI